MRVISMQNGGDVGAVFERWTRGVQEVEKVIKAEGRDFMYNDHLGFIGTCPSNLGTGLRASVMIKIPLLSQDARFKAICDALRLQARGSAGEHSASVGGKYDLSNKARIGYSEVELVQTMIDGVRVLIDMEKKLAAGESIDELVASTKA